MKIFIINNYFPEQVLGGSEIQCWFLAKYLAKAGHQALYLAVQGLTDKTKDNKQGVDIYYLSKKRENRLKGFLNFYKLLKKEKPNLCYIRVFQHFFVLNQICRFLKVPVVFNTSHINDCKPDLEKIKLNLNPLEVLKSIRFVIQRRLNFSSLKQVNVITINKHHVKLLKEKYNIETTQIYNSMEDKYEKNKTEKQKQVVWVNNLKPRKRPELFIKLADSLKNNGYKFLMIGNIQSDFDYYKNLIKKNEQENPDFKYLGGKSVSEVDEILSLSQIMVNTCQVEGFGNNFIQAWFNECPTITLSFDPDNIIEKNKIGFYSRTLERAKEDVKALMINNVLRQEMGERARQYALQNHSISNIKRYEEKFKEIIYASNLKKN